MIVQPGLRIAGAECCRFANGSNAATFHGDSALRDDLGSVEPFGEGVAGVAEDLAQDQVGHDVPLEPVQGRAFHGFGKFP